MLLIALTPSVTAYQTILNTAYTDSLVRPGVCPIILPQFTLPFREALTVERFEEVFAGQIAKLVDTTDALVITGGGDIQPSVFGLPNLGAETCDSMRDIRELALFRAYRAARKPILGVCRGHQLILLDLGMPHFVQHLDPKVTGEYHRASDLDFKDRGEAVHQTKVTGAYQAYLVAKLGRQIDLVSQNSHHHQAFCWNRTGLCPTEKQERDPRYPMHRAAELAKMEAAANVDIVATTPMVVEATVHREERIMTCQNHPEEYGPSSLFISFWLDTFFPGHEAA